MLNCWSCFPHSAVEFSSSYKANTRPNMSYSKSSTTVISILVSSIHICSYSQSRYLQNVFYALESCICRWNINVCMLSRYLLFAYTFIILVFFLYPIKCMHALHTAECTVNSRSINVQAAKHPQRVHLRFSKYLSSGAVQIIVFYSSCFVRDVWTVLCIIKLHTSLSYLCKRPRIYTYTSCEVCCVRLDIPIAHRTGLFVLRRRYILMICFAMQPECCVGKRFGWSWNGMFLV